MRLHHSLDTTIIQFTVKKIIDIVFDFQMPITCVYKWLFNTYGILYSIYGTTNIRTK